MEEVEKDVEELPLLLAMESLKHTSFVFFTRLLQTVYYL